MKWFRLWVDILDDHKIAQLNDYEHRVFIDLMALTSEQDAINGRLTWDLTAINRRLRRRYDHLKRSVETFQRVGLVIISDEGFVTITNWNKRQYKSDDSYGRVKKLRHERSVRNGSETANETPSDSDSDSDSDTYKNKKPPTPLKGEKYTRDFETFWKSYPGRSPGSKEAAFKSWQKRKDLPTIEILLENLTRQTKERAEAGEKNLFCPEWPMVTTYLNNGRWNDVYLKTETSETAVGWVCKKCHKKTNSLQAGMCHACYEG